MSRQLLKNQLIPLSLTVVVAGVLTVLLYIEIVFLNTLTPTDIVLEVRWFDIAIGMTIYLKTAIDFAIYIGHLMDKNPGWKGRIAIEIGTAVGNAAGTMGILLIWTFFKEVRWLLALMVLLASLVLFKLAEDSLEHAKREEMGNPSLFAKLVRVIEHALGRFNRLIAPVLKYVIPHFGLKDGAGLRFWPLFAMSFTVPFILGLDDFAGYVPLFTIVNVFGFGIGVFAGHMLLNALLYISPDRTIKAVKNPVIAFIGALAFVGLGVWGLIEVVRIIGH